MKNLFDLENPVLQMLSRMGDMIIVNLLFLVSCIPIITIGAALSGLNKACLAIALDDDRGIVKLYISGFKSNFKQATLIWLAVLVILISAASSWLLITTFCSGAFANALYALLGVLVFLVVGVLSYLIPLVVRYQNTIREHLYNAIILTLVKFSRTLILVLLNTILFLLPILSINVFIQTLVFWIAIGFAFLSYIASILLKPVFKELEGDSSEIK